jgi:protein-export membrane protein SecD
MQQAMSRLIFIVLLTLLGAYILIPSWNYFRLTPEQTSEVRSNAGAFEKYTPSWAPQKHIVPGLDLQGGVQLVLGVDLDKAVSDRARRIATRMREDFIEKGTAEPQVDHLVDEGKGDRVRATFASEEAWKTFESTFNDRYPDLVELTVSGLTHTWRVHPDVVLTLKQDAVGQTVKTISNRIDKLKVAQPIIERRGDMQISVQLPGYANPDQAKALIGRTAQLEFQMVDDGNDFISKLEGAPAFATVETAPFQRRDGSMAMDAFFVFPADKLADMKTFLSGKAPSGRVVKYGRYDERTATDKKMRTYTLNAAVELTGDDLSNAMVTMGTPEEPSPAVVVEFSPVGQKTFADLTTKNVGKRMAIVLEDVVDSAPVINEPITGGTARITVGGARTMEAQRKEAKDLVDVLKSGALPAPVTFREERTVGPSLGADTIQAAWRASLLGGGLVIAYMVIIYKMGGVIASLCALLNIFFVLVVTSMLGGTMSLPSIASLLLTMGMAVDANVIICERIREEFTAGKTARASVEAGYNSAFSAIFDSNMTTAIGGVVCLALGSGPVQEFAVTLLIGIATTMFTAVFVSKVLFDVYVGNGKDKLWI